MSIKKFNSQMLLSKNGLFVMLRHIQRIESPGNGFSEMCGWCVWEPKDPPINFE